MPSASKLGGTTKQLLLSSQHYGRDKSNFLFPIPQSAFADSSLYTREPFMRMLVKASLVQREVAKPQVLTEGLI